MSNSPLATYTNLSPNVTTPRRGKIQYIIPHCFVGQVTAKQGCDCFKPTSKGASSHYVVGKDGSIGMNCEEANRAWTTGGTDSKGRPIRVNGISGSDIDHCAVTIEVASDTVHPYAVTDAAYNALIRLMADIAKRNNLGELKWQADKTLVGKPEQQNVAVHRWFANKACPGDYLYNRMGDIVAAANALNAAEKEDDDMTEERIRAIVREEYAKLEAQGETARAKLEPSKWAVTSMAEAKAKGLTDGTRPRSYATREEVATMVLNAVTNFGGGGN